MGLRGRTAAVAVSVGEARFLVVACRTTPVALPAELVRGILQPEEVPEGGEVAVQGVVYPLTPLAERWDWSPSALTSDTRVVLCGEGGRAQALIVDRILGLVDVPRGRLTPLPLHFAGMEREWIAAFFLYENSVALVVHPACLFKPRAGEAKPPAVLEPPGPRAAAPPPANPAAELVEAEEVNLADQLDLEPLQEAGDAEDAPWADL